MAINPLFKATIGLVCFVGIIRSQVISLGKCPSVNVQQNFNVPEYMGKWYEMKRFFAIFEATLKCVSANYTLRDDGHITVNNTGFSRILQRYSVSIGDAVAPDPSNPAKLAVKFFKNQPEGNYWVLSTDYSSYSLVYSCSEIWIFKIEFCWILTRNADGIPDSLLGKINTLLDNYGIKKRNFLDTDQKNCPGR